ncbi:MAG TPA: FG-GAP repeat protein, partial [Planctomycetota bacterium]|nr:FG-GAP repeat protein [Planctomycetota bacterium]
MKFFDLLRVLPFAVFALPATAQTLLQTYRGSVGDEYGHAVLQTADQNADGYVDLLIGAPGWNGDRGYVRCLSGKFLATGTGSSELWTLFSTANAGARFGSSIAEVG